MKQNNVVNFPEQPIDLDRVRLESEAPCTVLLLPAVSIERRGLADWVEALLNAAAEGKQVPSGDASSSYNKQL